MTKNGPEAIDDPNIGESIPVFEHLYISLLCLFFSGRYSLQGLSKPHYQQALWSWVHSIPSRILNITTYAKDALQSLI